MRLTSAAPARSPVFRDYRPSSPPTPLPGIRCACGFHDKTVWSLINHSFGVEIISCQMVGAIRISAAQIWLVIQPAYHFRQAGCVIRAEVKSRVAPNFAKWGNVVGDNRAAGESRFEGRHAEWLVARSSRIDSCMAVQRAKLGLGLWAF